MTDKATLRKWLSDLRANLAAAVVSGVRAHVETLESAGIDFYGYGLLPGEPGEIRSIVAAYSCESEIKVGRENDQYRYYRYSVDEWLHFCHDGFDSVNQLLEDANARYVKMRTPDTGTYEYEMDECAGLYADALLEAMVQGLATAKGAGVFGRKDKFLVIWIADSEHKIMASSARRLNSEAVAREFVAEFG